MPERRRGVDAVIFDWGGTLTKWHDVDFHAESLALAQAVVSSEHDHHVNARRLHAAGETVPVADAAAHVVNAVREPVGNPISED